MTRTGFWGVVGCPIGSGKPRLWLREISPSQVEVPTLFGPLFVAAPRKKPVRTGPGKSSGTPLARQSSVNGHLPDSLD